MNLQKALTTRKDLSVSEKNLADYILKHRQQVLSLSVQALAKAAFVSPSTVVRLCQKLGLNGYAQFKIQLASDLQKGQDLPTLVNPDFPMAENDSFFEISRNLLDLEQQTLQMTYQSLNAAAYQKAAGLLEKADRIALFAIGDSFLDALSFQNRMMKLSKSIQFTPLPGEQSILARTLNEKDAAILISYSGLSERLESIFASLLENNVKMIVVTSNSNSPLSSEASVILDLPQTESSGFKLSTFAARFSIQYVLNLLYLVYFNLHYEENTQLRLKSEAAFQNHRY